jgi:phosphopantothenoylcysteine decarboxylase/phosphopantothenate--cysteine ligase
MTDSAMEFVTPLTFQALSGHSVHSKLLDSDEENAMGHINLARWADEIIIAPASANSIAKFAHGVADDLLSTVVLATQCKVTLAPSMNQAMWLNVAVQENIAALRARGMVILNPEHGSQACGETGPGRMVEPGHICQEILQSGTGSLSGVSVLISAGPTREPIDPVRYITNRSSGKMGYALAEMAKSAGADVTLVSGPVALVPPTGVKLLVVETAQQMYEQVLDCSANANIFIGSAAVADYSPVAEENKIKKAGANKTLLLLKTRDILASVVEANDALFTVGFAAETEHLEAYAKDKLVRKKIDMVAANWVGRADGGFDKENNAVTVYWRGGQQDFPMTAKRNLAQQLIKLIAQHYYEKNKI